MPRHLSIEPSNPDLGIGDIQESTRRGVARRCRREGLKKFPRAPIQSCSHPRFLPKMFVEFLSFQRSAKEGKRGIPLCLRDDRYPR
eukprot:gene15392-biopygen9240